MRHGDHADGSKAIRREHLPPLPQPKIRPSSQTRGLSVRQLLSLRVPLLRHGAEHRDPIAILQALAVFVTVTPPPGAFIFLLLFRRK